MFISAIEAVNSDSSADANSNSEAMPAILSSNTNPLNSKRSASSASEAECYNNSLGAGPLWWS